LKLDDDVPTIHRSKMQWVPSTFSIAQHVILLDEVKRKLERAETAHERNVFRSEIRALKKYIGQTGEAKYRWTSELFRTKQATIAIYISPKGKRYVSAPDDAKADLIIKNKKGDARPVSRLQLFERSAYAKMVKADHKEATVHTKRTKAKSAHRKAKKKSTLSRRAQ